MGSKGTEHYCIFSQTIFKFQVVEEVIVERAVRDRGQYSYYPMAELPY